MVYHSKVFLEWGGEKSFFVCVPILHLNGKETPPMHKTKYFWKLNNRRELWNMNRKRSFFKMKIKRVGRHTPVACVDSGHPPSQT